MKKVVVIGGGIVGLCAAYYLHKEGHKVSVVDKSSMDVGASYVNAGFISPSHFIPLASPGVLKQGCRWMMDASSPFYIKPRLNSGLIKWLWAFHKSCSQENVSKSMHPLKGLALMGQNLFKEIKASEDFNFHLESKGILVLCKTQSFLDKEQKMVELSSENGMEASSLNKQELQKLEPYYELDVLGGAWYKSDWHSTPSLFMRRMKNYLQEKGVRLHPNKAIKNIKFKKKRIEAISTDDSEFEADEFVLAAGVWSRHLAKKVGLDLRLEAGKGYRIDAMQETQISMPSIFAESKVAVTPMERFTRFAGTMELSGANHYIDKRRVKAIADSIPRYFKNFELQNSEKEAAQCGIRPLSPDGRPYIGKSSKCVNLTIATGHGMMGWTMGPSTGKLVTELISEKNPSMDIEAFHPDRRF